MSNSAQTSAKAPKSFDPNAAATEGSGIFGLPHTLEESALALIPVPWEATTSYGAGASEGPAAVIEASSQVDLFDLDVEKPYEAGIYCLPVSSKVKALNAKARKAARAKKPRHAFVNKAGAELNRWVRDQTRKLLAQGKIVGLVGGDHSVPLGALEAIADLHPEFGLLHFDAHSDTRKAYQGFTFSHASIIRNALETLPQIKHVVQVGIRDFCQEEVEFVRSQGARARIAYDRDLKLARYAGKTWLEICDALIAPLPKKVWVTFDIDGLDPKLCPNTGTPVPGGLEFWEAALMIRRLVESGRTIVGFDLNEIAPGDDGSEWDANVGARMLYKMCALTLASQGHAKLLPAAAI